MDNETDQAESMPRDKAELMERIQREWTALDQRIAQLSDAQMTRPDANGWSVKDNLAHLTTWEQFMILYHLQDRPPHEVMGLDEATMETIDEAGLNEIIFQRNRDRSVAEVVADFRRSHQQVLEVLEQMSYADLMKPHYPDDPEARPLINWVIGNTYEHYQEHGATIQALVE